MHFVMTTYCYLFASLQLLPLLLRTFASTPEEAPHLNGAHFRITVLEEQGFLDTNEDGSTGVVSFSGYLIDMLEALAKEERGNFTYTLLTPSGFGSLCVPRLDNTSQSATKAYDASYRTQYNCGASDVNDLPLMTNYSTDMYLGMYYVTPARLLENQFTIPFVPPYSGTLAMFGTATGIPNFEALVEQQQAGLQPEACAPGGTALIDFVAKSYPGIMVKGVFGDEDDVYKLFLDGTCQVVINDGPIAAQFVLRRSKREECIVNGSPIGVIGNPMDFGLSHYAIGVRRDIPKEVVDTLSYWLNVLMSCSPLDPESACQDGNLATFFKGRGGNGDECGYVLYPTTSEYLSSGAIAGVVVASVSCAVAFYTIFHQYRLRLQKEVYAQRTQAAVGVAARERDFERQLNEFLSHEIRNPISSALAALSFVSAKATDPECIPSDENRASLTSDIGVIDASLQFVNELLRNMLDLNRSTDNGLTLHYAPTDILRDVFDPVVSILFMRGALVDVSADCPKNLIISSDRMRLKQICLNLATNSTKFVEQGYIRLRAEVVRGSVQIHVEDSGPGIPPEKRKQLFAKFQASLDSLSQGTGIGLSLCKNLSELMGAELFLDDSFDSGVAGYPGTRFTLRLNQAPLEIEKKGPNEAHDSEEVASSNTELPEALSILFVDDDTVLRKMFARVLRRVAPTWEISEASNGETALRMVDSEHFDVIFVDQYMASVEKQLLGTETVQAMRAKNVNSTICGLSANDVEEQFMNAGANAFMIKPFPCQKDALKLELLKILGTPDRYGTRSTVSIED